MSNFIIPRGEHSYDVVVGAATRQAPLLTVRNLRSLYPEDFEVAATALAPDEWRLLFEVHHFAIYELTNPAFDPISRLSEVFDHHPTMEGARHAQLGSDRDVEDIAATIRMNLSVLTPDQQKAFWSIMVAAKQSDLETDEILTKEWWRCL